MKLRTELPLERLKKPIDCRNKILLLGSCFTEHIGEWLKDSWMDVCCNPWGILFNPASIAQNLKICLNREKHRPELWQQGQNLYSFDHHGSISATDEVSLYEQIDQIDRSTRDFLSDADHVIITLGTAWVYERNGHIVANCHKAPATEFVRRRMSVEEIVSCWSPIIERGGHFIFTVSPIRHLGDGLHGNQISKATLLLAIDVLQSLFPGQVEYLPVYELLIDDLRDYRFYADDLVHPAPLAIQAVKELLSETSFTPRLKQYIKEAEGINRTLNHRPSDPEAQEYKEMIQKALNKKKLLLESYSQSTF